LGDNVPSETQVAVRRFSESDMPSQAGRTILITGSNNGLGLRSATALAGAGARVVIACRNQQKGAAALEQVGAAATRSGVPGAQPVLVPIDLGDLDSVLRAAAKVGESVDSLDVLINNAGLMAVPFARTSDGFEQQIGTNHLGHFALTGMLLPLLLRADAPRVVTLASIAHRQGRVGVRDLNYEHRRYTRLGAYGQSKLANLLFSAELARRSEAAGLPLISVAAHPGVAATNLFDSMVPPVPGALALTHLGLRVVGNDERSGALSQLYAATMPDVRNDDYLGPNRLFGMRGPVRRSPRTSRAADPALAARLWELSVELTGQKYPEVATG
jgi:NAD(P)-dependent dehydrogenase (short-subunit alcohol dehydrogenase family)